MSDYFYSTCMLIALGIGVPDLVEFFDPAWPGALGDEENQ